MYLESIRYAADFEDLEEAYEARFDEELTEEELDELEEAYDDRKEELEEIESGEACLNWFWSMKEDEAVERAYGY